MMLLGESKKECSFCGKKKHISKFRRFCRVYVRCNECELPLNENYRTLQEKRGSYFQKNNWKDSLGGNS